MAPSHQKRKDKIPLPSSRSIPSSRSNGSTGSYASNLCSDDSLSGTEDNMARAGLVAAQRAQLPINIAAAQEALRLSTLELQAEMNVAEAERNLAQAAERRAAAARMTTSRQRQELAQLQQHGRQQRQLQPWTQAQSRARLENIGSAAQRNSLVALPPWQQGISQQYLQNRFRSPTAQRRGARDAAGRRDAEEAEQLAHVSANLRRQQEGRERRVQLAAQIQKDQEMMQREENYLVQLKANLQRDQERQVQREEGARTKAILQRRQERIIQQQRQDQLEAEDHTRCEAVQDARRASTEASPSRRRSASSFSGEDGSPAKQRHLHDVADEDVPWWER